MEEAVSQGTPPAGTPLEARDLLAEVYAVAAELERVAEVDTVVVLDAVLSAQAVLEDGSVFLFVNNRPSGSEALELSSPAQSLMDQGLRTGLISARVPEPPGSAKAVATSYDGGAQVASEVAQVLRRAGYDVLSLGSSLDDMRQYKDLGMLYLDTHGTAFFRPRNNPDGSWDLSQQSFGIQTSSSIQGKDLSAISTEVSAGDITYMSVQQQDGSYKTFLSITESFIAKNWSFDGGAVILHVCFAGAGPFAEGDLQLDPTVIQLAILGAGAHVLMSFDHLTWATFARPSVMHFLDRTLGAGNHNPESPPTRPFDDKQVEKDMGERDLLSFTRPSGQFLGFTWGGNNVNVTFDRATQEALLAPSIENMDVVDDAAEDTGRLTINGFFGNEPGIVEVGDISVVVESWTSETIVARIPYRGPGSVGPVIVKTPEGLESNEVPLTEWRGTVTLTVEGLGTLTATTTLEVRFRADVHRFRPLLEDSPQRRVVTSYISDASEGVVRGSGSFVDNNVTVTWSGQDDMEVAKKQVIDAGGIPDEFPLFGGTAKLNPATEKAELCLGIWGLVDQRTVTPMGTFDAGLVVAVIPPGLPDRIQGVVLGCVTADLDDDTYVIDSGNRNHTDGDLSFTLNWTQFTPVDPPNDNTSG